ncbi:MAG: hypothetical protein ACRDPK_10185, partial [Carbonactinosporaceae bacterium]
WPLAAGLVVAPVLPVLLAVLAGGREAGPGLAHAYRRAEGLCTVALLPLLAGVLGVYDLIADAAGGLR